MPCATENTQNNCCCCKHCEHDKLTGCVECCPCVPRILCLTFFPDDLTTPGENQVNHLGDGVYEAGLDDIIVSIEKDAGGDCVWSVQSVNWSISEEIARSTPGCLVREDTFLELTGVTNPITSKVGTLQVFTYGRIIVPLKSVAGCKERTCGNCVCFPRCLCINQKFEYDDDHPPDKDWADETTQRFERACWDSTLGDVGGWHAVFPVSHTTCWPEIDVLIELVEDVDGDCQLYATVGGYGEGVSTTDLNCDPSLFGGVWRFDTVDPTNASLPAEIQIGAVVADCSDRYGCPQQCCLGLPETLTATVQGKSGGSHPECTDPFEVTLTRATCGQTYFGTLVGFPWECDDEGPGTQTIAIQYTPCGIGAVHAHLIGTCKCTRCTTPAQTGGCGTMQITLSDPVDSDFGTSTTNNSECGSVTNSFHSGTIVSTLYPLYQEFYFSVGGIGSCCDRWHVIVTE